MEKKREKLFITFYKWIYSTKYTYMENWMWVRNRIIFLPPNITDEAIMLLHKVLFVGFILLNSSIPWAIASLTRAHILTFRSQAYRKEVLLVVWQTWKFDKVFQCKSPEHTFWCEQLESQDWERYDWRERKGQFIVRIVFLFQLFSFIFAHLSFHSYHLYAVQLSQLALLCCTAHSVNKN